MCEAEASEVLLRAKGIRVERIVSLGQASPESFWYDQPEAEWMMVVAGRARLTIAGESNDRILNVGDAIFCRTAAGTGSRALILRSNRSG